jgi:hypothetical protein
MTYPAFHVVTILILRKESKRASGELSLVAVSAHSRESRAAQIGVSNASGLVRSFTARTAGSIPRRRSEFRPGRAARHASADNPACRKLGARCHPMDIEAADKKRCVIAHRHLVRRLHHYLRLIK